MVVKSRSFYIPLDGLRALCFLSVFFFHCNLEGFQLGWAGVSVFFTISGFLITEILINSKYSGSYFKSFYIRRSLRIFPIYYLYIFFATVLFFAVKKHIPNDFLYYIFYAPNLLWINTNFISDLQPLMAHLWTLAIEEQFYLIWPAVIYFIPLKWLSPSCLIFISVALLYRIFNIYWGGCFYCTSILLPSQLDLLAFGGLLACYKSDLIQNSTIKFLIKISWIIGLVGLLFIVLAIGINHGNVLKSYDFLKSPESYQQNIFTGQIFFFLALIAVGLIKLCYENRSFFARSILSQPMLIRIGKLSYGLYLYHWPVIIIMNRFINNKYLATIISLILTYIIALLSYNLIETYFNNLKNKFKYK